MSQISHGTITISDLTDITDVYLQYALVTDTITRYQDIPAGTTWSEIYPTWQSGYQIWIRQVTEKEGLPNEYGTPYLDTAVNQLNIDINAEETERLALASKLKKIWVNLNPTTSYPAGTYAAAGINNADVTENNSSTYGFNTWLSNAALKLRYNAIDLTTLSASGLSLYYPLLNSNNIITNSSLGAKFTASSLIFYEPPTISGNTVTTGSIAATLNGSGLNIVEGSITLGTPDNGVYPFQVDNNGYLRAQTGWIGGNDSYVKLQKEDNTNTYFLNIRVNELEIPVGDNLYGHENVIDVLDVLIQQISFIDLWNGTQVWFNPAGDNQAYTIYRYDVDNKYYYDANELTEGHYEASTDTTVDEGKEYYIYSNNEYVLVEEPSGNPSSKSYYEFVSPEENWVEYIGDISLLPSINIAGLGQSLKFTNDSLGNQQKLLVSSSRNDGLEKAGVEIDPQFINFIINDSSSSLLQMKIGYNNDNNESSGSLEIIRENETIFDITDDNNHFLNTSTGVKFQSLGMFHYRNGLAIGIV